MGGYLLPNFSTLTTSLSQKRELQILREHSVTAFKTLTDKSNRIKKLVASFSIAKYTRSKVPSDAIHFNNASQAEQTIQSDVPSGEMHFNNASQAEQTIQSEINRERPLVKGKDGKQYPM